MPCFLLSPLQDTFTKLEATAAKLRASQEAAARELVDQQVGMLLNRSLVCGYIKGFHTSMLWLWLCNVMRVLLGAQQP